MFGSNDSPTAEDALNACVAYLAHGTADFSGMPPGPAELFRSWADRVRAPRPAADGAPPGPTAAVETALACLAAELRVMKQGATGRGAVNWLDRAVAILENGAVRDDEELRAAVQTALARARDAAAAGRNSAVVELVGIKSDEFARRIRDTLRLLGYAAVFTSKGVSQEILPGATVTFEVQW